MQISKGEQGEKESLLSDQRKEIRIKEKSIMGKTRDLFKKMRDPKGIFHTKIGTIKYIHGVDQREAEDIKKRWQEYTELCRKDLNDPDKQDGVITHLQTDIRECKLLWA